MASFDLKEHPSLSHTVDRLVSAGGDRLESLVLYGEAAHGETYAELEYDLLVVLSDLETGTLARVAEPVRRWVKKGQPMPRFFSPGLIEDAADVFPMEFLDIQRHHVILHGEDPLAELNVETNHLRLQCERELREKMMRLREAYLQAEGSERRLQKLLGDSYQSFVWVFRGALFLEKEEVPAHNAEVVSAFCAQADLDTRPFTAIERLRSGKRLDQSAERLFNDYYKQLTRAVSAIDRFSPQAGGDPS